MVGPRLRREEQTSEGPKSLSATFFRAWSSRVESFLSAQLPVPSKAIRLRSDPGSILSSSLSFLDCSPSKTMAPSVIEAIPKAGDAVSAKKEYKKESTTARLLGAGILSIEPTSLSKC